MLLGVDSRLRKLSFCTVHACTDSSDKALRGSPLCIITAIRVVTPVAKGYAKGLQQCMAVYCEPWLPSERISTRYVRLYLQKLYSGKISESVARRGTLQLIPP